MDVDKGYYCDYCSNGIFRGEQASGTRTVGQISWWDATYTSNPRIGSAWGSFPATFPNDMYIYNEILSPTPLLVWYKSNDYTGVVNWTAFARYVPEPATWALMIIDFRAIGGALQRQTTQRRHALA